MDKELETNDSPNVEDVTPEADETAEAETPKEEEPEYSERERRLFARAKKSEGENKVLREQLKKSEKLLKPTPESQSNEPDYATKLAVRAYLKSEGINHPDDQKWVQDEATRLKMNPDEILIMEHVKSHLETSNAQRDALSGMPKGAGRGGGKTQQDVDYWKDQKNPDGTYKTPDDLEMASKVIEARIKREEQKNKFSDDLYT